MAKPTGAIGINEIAGYWLLGDTPEYIYFGHRVAQMIDYWADDFNPMHLHVKYKACCTVNAANTIHLYWNGGTIETVTGPVVRQWSAGWTSAYFQPAIENMGTPDPHEEDPLGIETLRSRVGSLVAFADDKVEAGIIHSILIQLYHQDAYADFDAEIIDRTDVGADLVYLPNMPVSSWQMQRILCDTYNRLGYQSRLVTCLPLFKSYTPP